MNELPEVDAFIGLDQVAEAGRIFRKVLEEKSPGVMNLVTPKSRYIPDFSTPRFRLTPAHSAYVKIAEGCNHPCSFCVIPQMRGRHRSRAIDSVVREIRSLVAEGVKEINLISQDTTYYGMDLWSEKAGPRQPVDSGRGTSLVHLLDEIADIGGDFWVRLLYTHPAHWSDELIASIARNPHVAKYVDMPLQHIHGEMLQLMRRETSREHIENLITHIRAGIPGIGLRTTFIVGFPGETEEDFEQLMKLVKEVKFDNSYCFTYSERPGTPAANLVDDVPLAIKNDRLKRLVSQIDQHVLEINQSMVGKTELAMVESMARDGIHLQCRTENGRVALINAGSDQAKRLIGKLMPVTFTEAMPHSLRGELMIQE